jgi:hypothetical protein
MTQMRYILFSGVGAALASLGAVSALAWAEGRPAMAPINASSHWLWGDDEAGQDGEVDIARSGVGWATNIAAALMWGGLFGAYLHRARPGPARTIRDGAVLGAAAGLLDYGLLPRRLSPGWELAVSGRSVVLSMAAMAAGAALGGLVAQATDFRRGGHRG